MCRDARLYLIQMINKLVVFQTALERTICAILRLFKEFGSF